MNKFKIFLFVFGFTLSAFSQKDSLEIERLFNLGDKNRRIYPKKVIENFEKAVKIIDDSILSINSNNRYFLLKKSIMLDLLSFQYRKNKEVTKALHAIQKSLEIKEKIDEKFTLPLTYRLLGRLYLSKDSLKSIKNYNTAYSLAKKYKNDSEIVNILNQYAVFYYKYRNLKKVEFYAAKAYDYADSIDFKRGKAYALSRKAKLARLKKNYKTALQYSLQDLKLSQTENNRIGIERSSNDLGSAYRKLKQPKKAMEYYKKSLNLLLDMEFEVLLANRYLGVSNCYSDLQQYKEAFTYYRAYKRQQIKDLNIKKYREFATLDAKYTYEKQKTIDSIQLVEYQKAKRKKELDEASAQFWKYAAILISFFGLLFSIAFFIIRKKKEQISIAKFKNKVLKNEISYKQKDISDFALNISRNQKWREELLNYIKKIKKSGTVSKDVNFKALEKAVLNRDIIDKNTIDFKNKVDTLNNAFYEKLHTEFPDLTKTEIKLCSLIRLNIDNNEIAVLQNIAIESVYRSRSRLRKKLNLSSDEDLNSFLKKF